MRNRTFFATLLLFLLAINILIAVLSLITLRDTTHQARERSLNSQYLAASSLYRDMAALESRGVDADAELEWLLQPYRYLTANQRSAVAVYDNGVLLQTTGLLSDAAVTPPDDGGDRSVTLDRYGEQYLCTVSGALPQPFGRYTVLYQTDVTEEMAAWRQRTNTMLLAGGAVSLAMALFLLLLLGRLFRPLTQITRLSRSIAGGDYGVRLPEDGSDEVAQMARSFNHMAGEVAEKVTALATEAENRQRFVDNFSHELRTPLTNIHGYAEYLQRAALSEEDARFALDCILSESRRMQTMANRLLELSGLRAGEIRMEQIALSDLLREIADAMAPRFQDKEISLHLDCRAEAVTGDRVLLHGLFSNLLDNAVKASAPGSAVGLEAYVQGSRLLIAVSDQGKGMAEDELARIAEPFYRVDKARNREDGGAGLGLALCRQIAQRHGAELAFHSAPGKGTTATVTFTSQ